MYIPLRACEWNEDQNELRIQISTIQNSVKDWMPSITEKICIHSYETGNSQNFCLDSVFSYSQDMYDKASVVHWKYRPCNEILDEAVEIMLYIENYK